MIAASDTSLLFATADIGDTDSRFPSNVSSNVLKKVSTAHLNSYANFSLLRRLVRILTLQSSLRMAQVLEYCSHHRGDPPAPADDAEESRRRTTDISDWDAKFIQVDQEMLFEIILAANYLDIKPLLDVGCKSV